MKCVTTYPHFTVVLPAKVASNMKSCLHSVEHNCFIPEPELKKKISHSDWISQKNETIKNLLYYCHPMSVQLRLCPILIIINCMVTYMAISRFKDLQSYKYSK